jgi:hypothetical protein
MRGMRVKRVKRSTLNGASWEGHVEGGRRLVCVADRLGSPVVPRRAKRSASRRGVVSVYPIARHLFEPVDTSSASRARKGSGPHASITPESAAHSTAGLQANASPWQRPATGLRPACRMGYSARRRTLTYIAPLRPCARLCARPIRECTTYARAVPARPRAPPALAGAGWCASFRVRVRSGPGPGTWPRVAYSTWFTTYMGNICDYVARLMQISFFVQNHCVKRNVSSAVSSQRYKL